MDPLLKRQKIPALLRISFVHLPFEISQQKASIPKQPYNFNMILEPAPFLFLLRLIPHVSAVSNPDEITLFQRQASPTAAASTMPPTTTSTGDEISEPFSFALDGKIFPPDVVMDDVIMWVWATQRDRPTTYILTKSVDPKTSVSTVSIAPLMVTSAFPLGVNGL